MLIDQQANTGSIPRPARLKTSDPAHITLMTKATGSGASGLACNLCGCRFGVVWKLRGSIFESPRQLSALAQAVKKSLK